MNKLFTIALFALLSFTACAQTEDSLFVTPRGEGWMIPHKVVTGETVFILAKRYHVPPAILAGANGLNYQSGLDGNTTIYIPLSTYNQLKDQPAQTTDARPLYYKAKGKDDLYRISKNSNVQQHTIQQWNNLPDNNIAIGQTLFVGWVQYDATQISFPAPSHPVVTAAPPVVAKATPQAAPVTTQTEVIKQAPADTTTHAPASDLEQAYMTQTGNGGSANTEKGPAVFFDMPTHSSTFYAFHNTTPRGTIIKVFNPGNRKTIYVKVIGPMPETKQFANSIIGISGGAKAALGVEDSKAWCELSFGAL